MLARDDAVALMCRRPVDIAQRCGYTKLVELHNGWIRRIVLGQGDMTLQAHRGSYKTTCLVVSLAIIALLYPSQRSLFMRKTDADVAEVMAATATLLNDARFHELGRALYGRDYSLTDSTRGAVSTDLRCGVSGALQVEGLGCGGSLTGKHADRIFTDDIVNVKDRVSPAERERTKLIYQELQNIRNRGGRIVNTGTPWHKEDCFSLMPNITRYDCRATGLMTREEIAAVRQSMSPSLFAANYELKHIADENAMFGTPATFTDVRLIHDGIGHIDAAYGGGDYTAFTAMREHEGRYYAYGRLWPCHVDDVADEIAALCRMLRVGTVWCERNADKGYFARDFARMHPCQTYTEQMNKHIKIATYLKGAWGRMGFLDSEDWPMDADYMAQILDYTEHAAHDDAPDSCACAVRLLEGRGGAHFIRGL